MKRLLESMLEINGYILLLGIIACYSLITYLMYELIITNDLIYNFFSGQLPEAYLGRVIEMQQKWNWVNYVINPIVLLIKWLFISAFLSAGALLSNVKIGFGKIYKMTMWGEFIFIIVAGINLIVLYFSNIHSLDQINELALTNRMSVGMIVKIYEGPDWLSLPLYALNIPEILFTLFVFVGFGVLIGETIKEHAKWVISSYWSYLSLWIILLIYLNVTYA